jgi:hypothetical protein
MQRLINLLTAPFRHVPKQSATVRYMFPAFVTFAALLGAAALTSVEVSYIRLATNSTVVEAGSRFKVDVYARAYEPVNAVDITLRFDPNAVEVLGVDRGQSVITLWTQNPVIEKDKVILRGGTYRRGFIGEHLIASINLKAVQTGQSDFRASEVILLAGDGTGDQVSVAQALDSGFSLFIYDEDTSPESIGVNVQVNIVTDIDGDGKVTLKDISMFMAAWHSRDRIYDFTGDGRMTFRDFSVLLASYFFGR